MEEEDEKEDGNNYFVPLAMVTYKRHDLLEHPVVGILTNLKWSPLAKVIAELYHIVLQHEQTFSDFHPEEWK